LNSRLLLGQPRAAGWRSNSQKGATADTLAPEETEDAERLVYLPSLATVAARSRKAMTMKKSGAFETERRRVSAMLASMPASIAQVIKRVKRDDIRHTLCAEVMEEVDAIASQRGLMPTAEDVVLGGAHGLLVVHRNAILDELARRPTFLNQLKHRVEQALRVAHIEKINPHLVQREPDVVSVEDPLPGVVWKPASDLGLGTATTLDEAPDGFWYWVAERVRHEGVARTECGEDPAVRVLHLDPRGGPLARALVARRDLLGPVRIQELGPELSPTLFPWGYAQEDALEHDRQGREFPRARVVQNRVAQLEPPYDILAWAVPSPSWGAASNQGELYDHGGTVLLADGVEVVRVPWLGKVGPTRWKDLFRGVLNQLVPNLLSESGAAILRVPLGMRVQQRARGRRQARNGYEARPDLLDGVLDDLAAHGLHIAEAYDVEDEHPVAQPYVGRSRAPSKVFVLRRTGDEP
jgi:hypothetical protein